MYTGDSSFSSIPGGNEYCILDQMVDKWASEPYLCGPKRARQAYFICWATKPLGNIMPHKSATLLAFMRVGALGRIRSAIQNLAQSSLVLFASDVS